MVITRGADPFTDLVKTKTNEYFTNVYGQENFIITRTSIANNVSGRPAGSKTETQTFNVTGDLQFKTKILKEYIDEGIAVLGDGVFYTPSSSDISPNDKLTNSEGISYRLKGKIMGETIKGTEILEGWMATRLEV